VFAAPTHSSISLSVCTSLVPAALSEVEEWINYLRWEISRNVWLSVGIISAVALVLGFLNGVAVGYWMGASDSRAADAPEAASSSSSSATSAKLNAASRKSNKSKAE
jgi:hypothetical protein